MTNPIKRVIINHRRLRIPTCVTCAKCVGYHGEPRCTSARYLEHTNRLNCTNHAYALLENVRGTRFCEYEERENGERQDD